MNRMIYIIAIILLAINIMPILAEEQHSGKHFDAIWEKINKGKIADLHNHINHKHHINHKQFHINHKQLIGNSGIDGIVLIGPMCPVIRNGEPCPDKPYVTTIEIQKDGILLVTVQSREDGKFHVNLTPGEYKLIPLSKGVPPYAGPLFVKIESGKFTNVTIKYDSGIR